MRVLITGAAGFIGSHLGDRLLELGNKVFSVDNLLTGKAEQMPGASWVADITDRGEFYRLANIAEPDLIIHCAASYSDPDLWHRDIDTNVAGAVNVAAVAKHHHARVVYFQTVLPPVNSYAISKIAAENYLAMAANEGNGSRMPLLVIRLANVYGPRNMSGPIPTFTRKLLAGEKCTIAHTQRDFVYIDTLVDQVIDAIGNRVWGGYDDMTVHSGRQTHIRTVYELVSSELDVEGEFEEIPAAYDDQALFDFNGDEPVLDCSLSYGIRQTVDWYREHGVGETYTHLRVGG